MVRTLAEARRLLGGERSQEVIENAHRFMVRLEELTRETGIAIGSCGRCGCEPLLDDVSGRTGKDHGYLRGYVSWDRVDDQP